MSIVSLVHDLAIAKKSSFSNSDFISSDNGQMAVNVGLFGNKQKEAQSNFNNFFFAHLADQNNNNTSAFADVKTKDVSKISIESE